MHAAALLIALLLLSSETSLAATLPPREDADVQTLQQLPATTTEQRIDNNADKNNRKTQAAPPNGRCSSRSGVPQVRALELLPNERAQCAYFVAQSQ